MKIYFILRRASVILITSFLFFVSLSTYSQDDSGSLVHYQKKLTLNEFVFPTTKYKSTVFDIIFPDSIYNKGEIEIKHLTVNTIKSKKTKLIFMENKYTQVVYTIKKKDVKAFEKLLNKKNEGCIFKIEKLTFPFRSKYIISLSD